MGLFVISSVGCMVIVVGCLVGCSVASKFDSSMELSDFGDSVAIPTVGLGPTQTCLEIIVIVYEHAEVSAIDCTAPSVVLSHHTAMEEILEIPLGQVDLPALNLPDTEYDNWIAPGANSESS